MTVIDLEDDDIVDADRALFLMAEDQVEIDGPVATKARRRMGKLGVIVRDEALAPSMRSPPQAEYACAGSRRPRTINDAQGRTRF